MWQRIQTVFLLISIIALLVSLVMPIWIADVDGMQLILTPFYLMKPSDSSVAHVYTPYAVTAMFTVASITISIIEVTKYKNRVTQMKMGALNSFFLVGVIMCSYYFSTQLSKEFTGSAAYGYGMWLPAVSVVCNLIANRFIRRDEKMVRDSSRLR